MDRHKPLLMGDPAEGGVSASFLDEDLSGVDTSIPLIVEDIYDLKVDTIEQVKNKDETGELIKLKLRTTAPAKVVGSDDDKTVPEGHVIFHQISITETPKYDKDAIKRNVAAFVQAAGGSRLYPLEQYKGKIVRTKVKVAKEREDKETGQTYPARNEVRAFVKADDAE